MAKKEDYLTPEAIADIDEVDRYLSQKGKIDYSSENTHTQQEFSSDCIFHSYRRSTTRTQVFIALSNDEHR